MAYLNANIPVTKVWVRNEYMFDFKQGHGEFTEGYAHSVTSIKGNAMLFQILLNNGANWSYLPISAFTTKKDAPAQSYETLQIWDSFSYHINVIRYELLAGLRTRIFLKDSKEYYGTYQFTFDWAHSEPNVIDTSLAHFPEERKSAHFIELDNGNFCLTPNNRTQFFDQSLVTEPFDKPPKYHVVTKNYSVEQDHRVHATGNEQFYSLTKDEKRQETLLVDE